MRKKPRKFQIRCTCGNTKVISSKEAARYKRDKKEPLCTCVKDIAFFVDENGKRLDPKDPQDREYVANWLAERLMNPNDPLWGLLKG